MGFSSPDKTDAAQSSPNKTTFGDRLGAAFQSRYPLAGAITDGIINFGASPQNQAQPVNMLQSQPQQSTDQEDLVSMNAKPKEGGGLMTLLKLIGG